MAGLLEAIFGDDTETVEKLRSQAGIDAKRAEQVHVRMDAQPEVVHAIWVLRVA